MDPECHANSQFRRRHPAVGRRSSSSSASADRSLTNWLKIKNGYPLRTARGDCRSIRRTTGRASERVQAADRRKCPASRRAWRGEGPARDARAHRDRPAVEGSLATSTRLRSTREGMPDGPGDVIAAADHRPGLPIVILIVTSPTASSRSARSSSRSRRGPPPRRPPQYAAQQQRAGAAGRVLEQIVTDGGAQTAAQIEALREPPRRPARNGDDAA